MNHYAIEEYSHTIYVFPNGRSRDAWLAEKVNPARELRRKMPYSEAKNFESNWVYILPWQAELLIANA